MLRNRQFHRSFIILKPQDSGYSLHDGKEPAGYVKLEINLRKNAALHTGYDGITSYI